jgi:cation:H+ antiporter
MLVTITLLTLLYLQYIGFITGLLLLTLFVIYTYRLFKKRKEEEDKYIEESENLTISKSIRKELFLTIVGVIGVIVGARFTVGSAVNIATFFGVPGSIIGATLVAFGTSLPELAVDIRAASKGFMEVVMGDIVGSCFINSTLVLGILLIFTPFQANILVLSDLVLFSGVSNIILSYLMEGDYMGRRGGLVLIIIYCVNLLSLLELLTLRG